LPLPSASWHRSWVIPRPKSLSQSDVQQAHQNLRTSSVEIASASTSPLNMNKTWRSAAGAFSSRTQRLRDGLHPLVRNVDAFQRYPEILSIAEVDVVRPSQLKAFAARATLNAKESNAPEQTFTLTPAGRRPFYCLVGVDYARRGLPQIPIGLDLCDSSLDRSYSERPIPGRRLRPRQPGWSAALALGTPLYRKAATRLPPRAASQPHRIHRN